MKATYLKPDMKVKTIQPLSILAASVVNNIDSESGEVGYGGDSDGSEEQGGPARARSFDYMTDDDWGEEDSRIED